MSKKKRTKRHNFRKRYNRQSLFALKDLALVRVHLEEEIICHVYNVRTGKYCPEITESVHKALAEGELPWTLLLASFYRSQVGEEYAAFEEEQCSHPCCYEQMANAASRRLDQMATEGNTLQWLTVGYIASPTPVEFDYKIADKIFTELGAYRETLSQWECEKLEEKERAE